MMKRKKLLKSKAKRFQAVYKNGSALVLVMTTVVILVIVGLGLLSLGLNSRILAIRDGSVMAARCAADAGLTKAIFRMNENLKGQSLDDSNLPGTTDETLPNCNAVFSYKVDPYYIGTFKYYTVESVGRYNITERTVYGLLRLRGLGEPGVLVRDKLILKASTEVDGRDSRYPSDQQPEVPVQIGTTSILPDMVVLNNGVTVDGDVLVGYGGDPATVIKDLGATVTGDKESLDEEPEFPPVCPPPLPDYRGTQKDKELGSIKGYDLYIDETWNGIYSMIDIDMKGVGEVNRPGKLIIASGDVVLHLTGSKQGQDLVSINMGNSCEIIIMPGATLNLYVDADIFSAENSGFNNLGTPPDLKIWGNWCVLNVTQAWDIKAKSAYFGQIYAPNAAIIMNAKGDLYGAFTAYSFEMKSGGNLYYDGALKGVNPGDEGVRFILKRWWE